ncbi:MAG: hypothetical protein ACRC7R_02355, partial [Sarcina sp.]
TLVLLMLLLIQSFKYYSLKSFQSEIKDDSISYIQIDNRKSFKLNEFVNLIKKPYIEVNTIINEKNNMKATLNFEGNVQELIEYITCLDKEQIFIKQYSIEKNETIKAFMEVSTD